MLTLIHFNPHERELFETFLNQKAQKGYALQWFNDYFICFKKSNQPVYYYVDYNQRTKWKGHRFLDESQLNQISFYEESGYQYVTNYKYFIVYSSEEELSMIHTDPAIETASLKATRQNTFLMHVLLPTVVLITTCYYLSSWTYDFIDIISHNESILFFLLQFLFIPFSFIIGRVKFIQTNDITKTFRRIRIRTFVQIASAIILYFASMFLCYLFSYDEELVFVVMLGFPLALLLGNLLSNILSNKNQIVRFVTGSFVVFLAVMTSVALYDNFYFLNPFYDPSQYGQTLFSEQMTGKVYSSYYQSSNSILFTYTENYLTLSEPKEVCPPEGCHFDFDYMDITYYHAKMDWLIPYTNRDIRTYYNLNSTIIDDVTIYQSYEVNEANDYHATKVYCDEPLTILAKDNQTLNIRSKTPLTMEQIQQIIQELEW